MTHICVYVHFRCYKKRLKNVIYSFSFSSTCAQRDNYMVFTLSKSSAAKYRFCVTSVVVSGNSLVV